VNEEKRRGTELGGDPWSASHPAQDGPGKGKENDKGAEKWVVAGAGEKEYPSAVESGHPLKGDVVWRAKNGKN